MKNRIIIFCGFLLFVSGNAVFAQNANYHSANKLRVTFSNSGEIEASSNPSFEWPIGTGHEYLDLSLPLVVVQNNNSQELVSFSMVPSYANSAQNLIAMSNRQETWPASWPDKPSSWNGSWDGFFGRGQLNADQESFTVLEDAARGLRLTVRGWQWAHYLAQDMLFWYFELTNTGTANYESASLGYFVEPNVGGDSDQENITFDLTNGVVSVADADNIGKGRGVAEGIGTWSPVGLLGTMVLETPSNSTDGIDNDGDGLIDESRSDGIDNDGDWVAATDDVGADGVADTGDEGEGDGIPTAGEPNFDATDIDESDEIGLTSFAAFAKGGLNLNSATDVGNAFEQNRFDDPNSKDEFLLGSGGFSLASGETQRFSVVLFVSANPLDQTENEMNIHDIFENNYRFPKAPPRPKVTVVAQDKQITLYWEDNAESSPGFEGYKIYRSSDPGFNDIFKVTNDRGVLIYSKVIQSFDLNNSVKGLFGLQAGGFRYFLGKNTGLKHWWTDTDVDNGKTYYYAVVAYNRGDVEKKAFPAESSKSIVLESSGNILTDINTVSVVPTVESSVFQAPEYTLEHTAGFATGRIEIEVVDRTEIKQGGRFQLSFDDSSNSETTYSLVDITNPANPFPVFSNSTNYSTGDLRNDADPLFNGLHTFLFDQALAWDSLSTRWKIGTSNWTIQLTRNSNLGTPQLAPADYEVRFGSAGSDTALFSTPIPVPFQVWNVTENKKQNILVLDQNADGAWNSGENIFIVTGESIADFKPVIWTITLTAPSDPSVTSIPPEAGDVAFISTFKPFTSKDTYTITTKGISEKKNIDNSALENIAVVPNPYIVNSTFEQRGLFTGGKLVRKLEFIHLPPKCKIRIFDLRGRLIDTINHEASLDDGSAFWDLQTDDNDLVAYGIYLYHIQAPGIGEKIGRFAIIR